MKIQIENTYSDNHSSVQIREVDDAVYTGDLDELWDELWTYTGDGTGEALDAFYEITILEADDTSLVGLTHEWA